MQRTSVLARTVVLELPHQKTLQRHPRNFSIATAQVSPLGRLLAEQPVPRFELQVRLAWLLLLVLVGHPSFWRLG